MCWIRRRRYLIPKIGEIMAATPHNLIVITGVGEVYPYVRSHTVLNNLQSAAKDSPTVIFFPGSYTHALATGASLDLFLGCCTTTSITAPST